MAVVHEFFLIQHRYLFKLLLTHIREIGNIFGGVLSRKERVSVGWRVAECMVGR